MFKAARSTVIFIATLTLITVVKAARADQAHADFQDFSVSPPALCQYHKRLKRYVVSLANVLQTGNLNSVSVSLYAAKPDLCNNPPTGK